MLTLADWYATHGRHDLPWRQTRDRWHVLVSEVMLGQTQVTRVATVWAGFMDRFPTPAAMAAGAPADVIRAWGTLGYPRRARRLWESARLIHTAGWPEDLTVLPGVGRYTAAAVAAQADGADVAAVETNIRRVLERRAGRHLTPSEAEAASVAAAPSDPGLPWQFPQCDAAEHATERRPPRSETDHRLVGRERLLALMDVGALLCRPRSPRCEPCPLRPGCATAAGLTAVDPATLGRPGRQAPFAGSFRQRRGRVLAALRVGPTATGDLDPEALAALVADGLATVAGPVAHLPH